MTGLKEKALIEFQQAEVRKQNPRREFLAALVHALHPEGDIEMVKPLADKRGPLGGRSQQLQCVFTDSQGKKHGVVINAYVGEPDISLTEDGEVVPNGR